MADAAPFPPARASTTQRELLIGTLIVQGGILLLAVLLAWWAALDWAPPRAWGWSVLLGALGALPTVALLPWSLRTSWPPAVRLRALVIEHIAPGLVTGAPWRLWFYSVSAGVSEEALFRGVLQQWLAEAAGVAPAVLLCALLFGLCHAASREYAVVATLIGAWWGALYALTGDLYAAMLAHALHDLLAMWLLRRELGRPAAR